VRSLFESNEVSDDAERFIGQVFTSENVIFEKQRYLSGEVVYNYLNQNDPSFPNRGMELDLVAAFTANAFKHLGRWQILKLICMTFFEKKSPYF